MADSEKALDNWVRGALTNTFGPVAEERLPDEWLRLLDGARGE